MRLGHQNRYQKWFQKKFLASPGGEHLVPDLVRFVCCCFHPTNQILQVRTSTAESSRATRCAR